MSPADLDARMTLPEATAADAEVDVHRLYRETVGPLRATLRRLTWAACDVDDLLQDVFVAALDRPAALARAVSPRAWLYGIAFNHVARRRRRHMLRRYLGLEEAPEPVAAGPHEELEQREAEALVHAALEQLAPKKRAVFVLYELDGFSGEEISEAVGCPLKTVWTRLFHARRELDAELKKLVKTP